MGGRPVRGRGRRARGEGRALARDGQVPGLRLPQLRLPRGRGGRPGPVRGRPHSGRVGRRVPSQLGQRQRGRRRGQRRCEEGGGGGVGGEGRGEARGWGGGARAPAAAETRVGAPPGPGLAGARAAHHLPPSPRKAAGRPRQGVSGPGGAWATGAGGSRRNATAPPLFFGSAPACVRERGGALPRLPLRAAWATPLCARNTPPGKPVRAFFGSPGERGHAPGAGRPRRAAHAARRVCAPAFVTGGGGGPPAGAPAPRPSCRAGPAPAPLGEGPTYPWWVGRGGPEPPHPPRRRPALSLFFPRHPAVLPQAALLSVLGGSRLSPRQRRARGPGLAASHLGRLFGRRRGVGGGGAAVAREGWSVPILRPLPPPRRDLAPTKKKKTSAAPDFINSSLFSSSPPFPPPPPLSPPPPHTHTHRAAARVGRLCGRPSARGGRRRPGRHLPAALPLRAVGQGAGRVGERERRGTARGRAPHDARPPTPRPAPRRPPPPRAGLCVPFSPLSHCISSLTKKNQKTHNNNNNKRSSATPGRAGRAGTALSASPARRSGMKPWR